MDYSDIYTGGMISMIGNLKSKNVRTVHNKKVVRLQFDIPYENARTAIIEGEDLMEWLDHRVGSEIGIEITTLDEQGQEGL